MNYREAKMATATAAAQQLADDPRMNAVYLGGSLTAGLGSSTSDVDVFVLLEAEEDGVARQIRVGDERLDVETYTVGWVRDALAKLGRWSSSRRQLRHEALSADQLDFLIRMRDAEVIKDSSSLAALRSALAAAEDRLRQHALSSWALEANGHLSDLKGALQDGDHGSAGLMTQSLLSCAGKAVTTAAGDLYFNSKWVHRQLRRSLPEDFPHDLFRELQSGIWSVGGSSAKALEVLFLQQTMMAAAQLLGWNGTGVGDWPFWETGKGAYRRNPRYNTIHLTEGVLLNNELQRQIVVKPDVALVWALCNGQEEDDIVSAAESLAPQVCGADGPALTPDRARELLALLHSRGLVSREIFR